jgi:hypothetical protein
MAFGNARDEIGGPGQGQGGREAADDGRDLPFQPNRFEGLIDRSAAGTRRRDEDVPTGGISGGCDPASAERVADAHDADEAVPEQELGPHLRAGRRADDSGLQVDAAVAERAAVPVRLGHEAQAHAGSLPARPGDERRPEILHETVARAQGERSGEPLEIESPGGPQYRLRLLHQPSDLLSQLQRPRGGNEAASRPDQQRIAGRLAKPGQARLIAEGLSRSRRAARATLPSASRASRVISRLRSGADMGSL